MNNDFISTRESIIKINNIESNYKDTIIFTLIYTMYFLLYIFIVIILSFINVYSKSTMNIILLFSLIFYIIGIIYKYKISSNTSTDDQSSWLDFENEALDVLREGAKNLAPKYLNRNRCPVDCTNKM